MTGVALAAELIVIVRVLVPATATLPAVPVRVNVEGRLNIAAPSSPPTSISKRLELKPGVEGSVELPLAQGTWTIEAFAEGYWSPPQSVQLLAGPTPTIALRLYPTASLSRLIEGLPEGQNSVEIDFRGSPESSSPVKIPEGFVTCPVERKQVVCAVPVGRLDVRFGVNGFIPSYMWSYDVEPGTVNHLPTLRLVPGASIAGFVRNQDRKPSAGIVVELLTPSGERIESSASVSRGPLPVERERYPLQVVTNRRGFFQIVGAPVGEFQLAARHGNLAGLVGTRVEPNRETRLRDFLDLEVPSQLQVTIEPALAPNGTSWTLRLVMLQPYRQPLHQRTVRAEQATVLPVTRGVYSLEVWNAQDRWFIESVTIDGTPPPVLIRLPITRVRGELTLGEEPLTGHVIFGGLRGPMHVGMTTDSDGRFEGTLPHDGNWVVGIEANDPPVKRTLARVPVVRSESTGEAHVSIKLPDTTLRGRVVDEAGADVRGFVKVIPDAGEDRAVQVQVEPGSPFVVRGLPEGTLRVEAEAEGGRRSDLATLTLTEGNQHETVLVVKGERAVDGQLSSTAGVPLIGASILAFEEGLYAGSRRYTTDANGRFTLYVRPGVRHLTLLYWADGHATRMSSAVATEAPLSLTLDRVGASLVLDFGRELDLMDAAAPFQPVLSNGNAHVPVIALLRIVARRGLFTDAPVGQELRTVILPQMNSGDYALCIQSRVGVVAAGPPPRARCEGGTAASGGELRLTLSPESWPTGR